MHGTKRAAASRGVDEYFAATEAEKLEMERGDALQAEIDRIQALGSVEFEAEFLSEGLAA